MAARPLGKRGSWLQAGHLAHVLKERSLLLVGQGAAQLERLLAGWEVQPKPGRPGGPQREPPACCLPASSPSRGWDVGDGAPPTSLRNCFHRLVPVYFGPESQHRWLAGALVRGGEGWRQGRRACGESGR